MKFDEYQAAALRTEMDIPPREKLSKSALGLTGEAGEVAELVKKHLFHDKPIDVEKLKKELGDVLWYVAATAACFGIELDDVARTNVAKLAARYPAGTYSHEACAERADERRSATSIGDEKVTVVINGRSYEMIAAGAIDYEELVELAGMTGTPSMTWKCGSSSGILHPGEGVFVLQGLRVEIAHTGNA